MRHPPTYPGPRLALLLLASLLGCRGESAAPAGPPGLPRNTDLAVAYVGEEACRECHLGIATTSAKTGMGKAFYPLTPDIVVEDFSVNNEFEIEATGVRYRMFERDGKYWQRQFVLDSAGREFAAEERELVYVVGSNNHSRSYVTMIGEKLFQAPVCWYPDISRWDLCPGFEFGNEHFGREVSINCLTCHNGRMELVEGQRNEFERPFPHGIGCERCHGPGELHVARWSGGETPEGQADLTIVNPRRLPQRERLDVCAQCHLGDARATANVGRYGRDLQDFRPGLKLADYQIPYHYEQKTQWDFGLSAQVDRMVQSACFKQSGGKLECLTCHNPHVTVYHEERPADYFRKKCLGCHAVEACTAPMDRRSSTTPADDCVDCHMRSAEPDDQRHTTMTDHWIRRDIELVAPDLRENYRVEPMFPEDLASLSDGERRYMNARAAFLLATDAPRSRYAEMWAVAEREFLAAIEAGFDNEASWFFLGKTWDFQGRKRDARGAFERVVRHDPTHHDGNFALGKVLAELGEIAPAADIFRAMIERDPADTMALSEYGRCLFALGRMAEAHETFSRAIEHAPWDATLQINYGMSLAALGRMGEAARAGERAVSLDPEMEEAWHLYFNAMREAGNPRQADEGQRWLVRVQQTKQREAERGDEVTGPRMGMSGG